MSLDPHDPRLNAAFRDRREHNAADEINTRLKAMGLEGKDIFYRSASTGRLQLILETGTDRTSKSELCNDDNVDFEGTNRYEELAMYNHGIEDRRFTTYAHDGAESDKNIGRALAHSYGNHVLLVYRKDPNVVKIEPREINPKCVAQSGGFVIFKDDPSKFLVGIVTGNRLYTPAEMREKQDNPLLSRTM